jgi:HAE1 family hydrophobic/amphiphilic exporter-1
MDTLRSIAEEVAAVLETVEGTTQVDNGLAESDEELRITIDREEAINYGLTVAQVFTQIAGRLSEATTATTLVAADKDYDVYVMSGNDIELTRELVKDMPITGTDENGESVEIPLSDIAKFENTLAMSAINRADQTRYVSVTAGIADGYNIGLVASEVEERLELYDIPAGYRLVFSGENETINEAMGQLVLMLLLAIVFMYLIMVAQFQSLKSPFIVMFTIPLAFTGGFLALLLCGMEVSIIALIGFIMLMGVIVNNGIVLVDYINQLRLEGMERREAIVEAGITRIRPILMTTLTTVLGQIVMAVSQDVGSILMRPIAVVSIGGLLYATLMTLFVVPCIYDMMNKKQLRKIDDKDLEMLDL